MNSVSQLQVKRRDFVSRALLMIQNNSFLSKEIEVSSVGVHYRIIVNLLFIILSSNIKQNVKSLPFLKPVIIDEICRLAHGRYVRKKRERLIHMLTGSSGILSFLTIANLQPFCICGILAK